MGPKITKDALKKLSKENPTAFYQKLRERLSRIDRIAVNRLTDEQVLIRIIEKIEHGKLSLYLHDFRPEGPYPLADAAQSRIPSTGASSNVSNDSVSNTSSESNGPSKQTRTSLQTSGDSKTRWIAFQVVDEDSGAPLSNVELKVQLPGGAVRKFQTDGEGIVKIEDLEYGPFHILEIKHKDVVEITSFG